jgi:Tol biopolymer transport system component
MSGGSAALSPDDRFIAFGRSDGIWVLELRRGALSRFTSDSAPGTYPIWSPDGSRIVFGSLRTGIMDLYQKSTTTVGREELLLRTPVNKAATDWSADGRVIVFRSPDTRTGFDIWALPLEGDKKPFPVVQTPFEERDAQLSPDGHWIAYQSNESGRFEVYVQPFPGSGRREQASINGGAQVRWRRDGRELFYIALDGRLMAVPLRIASGQPLELGTPVPLFTTRVGGAVQFDRQQYVVSADGQRFLMNTVADDSRTPPIIVITNWKPKS